MGSEHTIPGIHRRGWAIVSRRALLLFLAFGACAPDAVYMGATGAGAASSSADATTATTGITSGSTTNAMSSSATVCSAWTTCDCINDVLSSCPLVLLPFGQPDCHAGVCANVMGPPEASCATPAFQPTVGACEAAYLSLGSSFNITPPFIDDASQKFAFQTGSFTVEAWVRPRMLPQALSCLVGRGDEGSSGDFYHLALIPNGSNVFQVEFRRGNITVDGTTSITDDGTIWWHIAGVYDESAHAISVYVNGTSAGPAQTTVGGAYLPGSATLFVGVCGPGSTGKYIGEIANVAIYGRALSKTEINKHAMANMCP